MSFLDVRFPLDISYGAVGGPEFSTEVVAFKSGLEQRNQNWDVARCSWDVAKACKNRALVGKLITFFRVAKGRAFSFRFRDFTDFTVARSEGVFVATDVPDVYQLAKKYRNEAGEPNAENRAILLPTTATIWDGDGTLLTAGIDYTLDPLGGLVTMAADSPPIVPAAWSGEFDVPVRFDIDKLPLTIEDRDFWRSTSIQLIEVKEIEE